MARAVENGWKLSVAPGFINAYVVASFSSLLFHSISAVTVVEIHGFEHMAQNFIKMGSAQWWEQTILDCGWAGPSAPTTAMVIFFLVMIDH